MIFGRRYLVLVAALLVSSCSSITDPSKNASETFAGTIPLGGFGASHTFTANKRGEYSVTINTLTPPTGSLVGVGFGIESSGICLFQTQNAGQIGKPTLNSSINPGHYCVQLYDVGTLAQAESYTITVSHP